VLGNFPSTPLLPTQTYTRNVTIHLTPAAQGKYIIVMTDADKAILEPDETDNISVVNTNVTPVPADLIVTNITVPAQNFSGEKATISFTVKNVGAFETWIADGDGGLELLQDLYRRWPFFRTVLSNMAQVLSKADMGLAARYSELVEDEALRRRVFGKIVDEHDRTIRMHKLITGQDDLLADNPALARSVFNRFPYLEPLNHLQVELLGRYRSGDDDELVQRGILLTMSGLATALRNSG